MQRGAILALPGIDHDGPREFESRADGDDDGVRWQSYAKVHAGVAATHDIETASLDLAAAFEKFVESAHTAAPAAPHASTTADVLRAAVDHRSVADTVAAMSAPVAIPPAATNAAPAAARAAAQHPAETNLAQLLALEGRVSELEKTIGWLPRRLDRALQRSIGKQLTVIERRFTDIEDAQTLKDVNALVDSASKSSEGILQKKAAYAKLESSSVVAKVSILHNALKSIEAVADDLPQIHQRLTKVKQIVDNTMTAKELDELLGNYTTLSQADAEMLSEAQKELEALQGTLPAAFSESTAQFEGIARGMAGLQAQMQALGVH